MKDRSKRKLTKPAAPIMVRVNSDERARYESLMLRHGFKQLAPFVRHALNLLDQAA